VPEYEGKGAMMASLNGVILFTAVFALQAGYVFSKAKWVKSSTLLMSGGSSSSSSGSSDDWPKTGNKHVLITGGAGYIGSHTIVCLLNAGYDVTVVDNMVNSNSESLTRVLELTQCDPSRLRFRQADLCDLASLESVFKGSPVFDSCIHFAGLKAVGESVKKPLEYYENNIGSTFNLLKMMDKYQCKSIVFSSSATVYGSAEVMPITEDTPVGVGITNPYGKTKYMIEEILRDYQAAKAAQEGGGGLSVVILRYFNPVGAHPSGRIGEDPNGIPNNLMPYVSQVVVGRRKFLTVYGNDYKTKDGTGVRDYIHVMDLAEGHVAALKYIDEEEDEEQHTQTGGGGGGGATGGGGGATGAGGGGSKSSGKRHKKSDHGKNKCSVFNLGTGVGYSVLDMVKAMEVASGRKIPYEVGARREGDIATCYADPTKARNGLKWEAKKNLADMCKDLWSWQSNNPEGYASKESTSSAASTSTSSSISSSSSNAAPSVSTLPPGAVAGLPKY